MKTEEKNIDNLKWVRIFDPTHIPKKYIDQIKQKEFTTENFYKYQNDVCLLDKDSQLYINPFNLLFVLIDDTTQVKGVLWMVIDDLSNSLVINTFSIDKDYWFNGKAVQLLIEKAAEIKEKEKLERVYWITRSPKHSEKFGFKRSKNVLMEYTNGKFSEKDVDGRGSKAGRDSSFDDKGTTEVFEEGS